MRTKIVPMLAILFVLLAVTTATISAAPGDFTPLEQLGKALYFDANLSANSNQACASCHAPEAGFTGPVSKINLETAVYPGSFEDRFGNRKPPSAAYAGDSPIFYYDDSEGLWLGGMFWDGRATGWVLGDPLAEQAKGPFLNPLEMALPNARALCIKLKQSNYADLYRRVYGKFNCGIDVENVYNNIGSAIAAYERSSEVNPFSSKYDLFLAGQVELTAQELRGLELFEGQAMCAACHPGPLFTDFSYDNLGVPRNPDNPFYTMDPQYNPDGEAWIDPGLGGFLQSAGYTEEVYLPEWGKHKVPTLRNVDKRPFSGFVKAYAHNGYFKSLDEIVHFYNTRDVEAWPEPEVAANINVDELGNLGLSVDEEAALVAFLETLSDGFVAP